MRHLREKLTCKKIGKLEKKINMFIFHIPYKFISLKLHVHIICRYVTYKKNSTFIKFLIILM